MSNTYLPPANLKDFDRSATQKDTLYQIWHQHIHNLMTSNQPTFPAFFDILSAPVAGTSSQAAVPWTGLPGIALRLNDGNVVQAAQLVEKPINMGSTDPIFGKYTPTFYDAQTHAVFNGPQYRPQDEYLEWVSVKDSDGVISEVIFTCEGPEYWMTIAQDRDLLVSLYQELLPDNVKNQFQESDLFFPRDVQWGDPNDPSHQAQTFTAGTYNPYNKWNMVGAIHLTQPANTLSAEIGLAQAASLLYGSPTPVTKSTDLICCAAYGEVNRNSDPIIGYMVNSQVVQGKFVSLRNPVGLYMKSIDTSQFSMPDGSPIPNFDQYFVPLRQSDDGQMIVRARFKVPDGITSPDGKQLQVSDLLADGAPIVAGGQIANAITMQLFALTLPGAPHQDGQMCLYRPCPNPSHPEIIDPKPYGQPCETAARVHALAAHPTVLQAMSSGQRLKSRVFVQP